MGIGSNLSVVAFYNTLESIHPQGSYFHFCTSPPQLMHAEDEPYQLQYYTSVAVFDPSNHNHIPKLVGALDCNYLSNIEYQYSANETSSLPEAQNWEKS